MARTSKKYKWIEKWIEENPDIVDGYHVEYDGGGDDDLSPWGHWIYLKRPWTNASDLSMIHEHSLASLKEIIKIDLRKDEEWWNYNYGELE